MRSMYLTNLLLLVLFTANPASAETAPEAAAGTEIVCKSFCEATFERTVASPLNAYTANQIYSLKITELNRAIESVSGNNRQAAFAAAVKECRRVIEEDVEGYNKEILALQLYTDESKRTPLNLTNLSCLSNRVLN